MIENLTEYININENILTVKELLKIVNYNVKDLYIDKFWESIKSNKWIYIDNEMLKWMGYSDIDINSAKRTYLILLKDNFEENNDYKILNSKEFLDKAKRVIAHLENIELNTHNKTKHLILSPDCFKQSLMMLRTDKSKEIRKYYIELEKIFNFYLQYQNKYQELKNLEIIKQLEEEKEKNKLILEFTINKNPMLKQEKVYAVTTKLYASQNIIKVGRTVNKLVSRLSSYNTGKIPSDKYEIIWSFDCVDSKSFESYLFLILKFFKISNCNEMYKINFDLFTKLMNIACNNYSDSIDKINKFIEFE